MTEELIVYVDQYKGESKFDFIVILDILSLFYTFLNQKVLNKSDQDETLIFSTKLLNTAEPINYLNPLTQIAKAYILYSKGDYDNSDSYFANALSANEQNLKNRGIFVLCLIGQAMNKYIRGQYKQALIHYKHIVEDHYYVSESILESMGIILYKLKKENEAFLMFQNVLEINKNNFRSLVYMSLIELNKSYLNKDAMNQSVNLLLNSFKVLFVSKEINIDSACLVLINITCFLLRTNQIELAENLKNVLFSVLDKGKFKLNTTKFPTFKLESDKLKSIGFTVSAFISHIKKNFKEALNLYSKAIGLNSSNLQAQFGLGQLYFYEDQLANALNCFDICKYTSDHNSLYEVNKMIMLIKCKMYQKNIDLNTSNESHDKKLSLEELSTSSDNIINLIRQLLEINPEDLDCLMELAQLLESNNPLEALKEYEKCLELVSNNKVSGFLYNIDEIYHELLNNISSLKLSLKLASVDVLNNLKKSAKIISEKIILLRNDESKNREAIIKLKALELDVMYNTGIYYEYNKDYSDAYKLYKLIIKSNCYFVDAYCRLALIYYFRNNMSKCFEYINKSIEIHYEKDSIKSTNEDAYSNIHLLKPLKCFKKPINPFLLKAIVEFKEKSCEDALKTLCTIIRLDDKDPFTYVLTANINYEMAYQARGEKYKKDEFEKRILKALTFYYAALELDSQNVYAAIGIANILAEFNQTGQALDVYKSVNDKLGCYSKLVNEALIYMSEKDKKYFKSVNILGKVLNSLKGHDNSEYEEIELIYIKALYENSEYDKAIKLIKTLIFKCPDNLMFRYNYAVILKSKSEEVFKNSLSRSSESIEAKQLLDRSISIFENIVKMIKEKKHQIVSIF